MSGDADAAKRPACPRCGLPLADDENAALLPDSGFIDAHVTCIPEASLRVWAERVAEETVTALVRR